MNYIQIYHKAYIWILIALSYSLTFGCLHAQSKESTKAIDKTQQLYQWVDQYYSAQEFKQMSEILSKVQKEYPTHHLRWELESYHSQFDMHSVHTVPKALLAVSQNPSTDSYVSLLHLMQTWPRNKRLQLAQQVLELSQSHPSAVVRASSAWTLRHRAHYMNEQVLYQQSTQALGTLLPLSIIGTWDNDQGKGLDTVFPPEQGIDLREKYQGKLLPIHWRSDYPKDLRGKINFKELVSPKKWQVAYATTAIQVEQESTAELRVTTSDPFKVWVDGQLYMHITQVDGWLFDAFVIPLQLSKGQHQILIKSAQKTGQWMLSARLTAAKGAPLNYQAFPDQVAQNQVHINTKAITPLQVADVVKQYQSHFSAKMPMRQQLHTLALLSEAGLSVECLKLAEKLAVDHPKSLLTRFNLMLALWEEGERGRTADLLNQLLDTRPLLPLFVHYQTNFWQQQHLDVNARKLARKLLEEAPQNSQSYQILANLYQKKNWYEESYHLLTKAYELDQEDVSIQSDLLNVAGRVGKVKEKELLLAHLAEASPYLFQYIKRSYHQAKKDHDIAQMIHYAKLCTQQWTQSSSCYALLARAYWQDQQVDQAFAVLDQMSKLNPLNPLIYQYKGEWLLLQNKSEEAWKAWEEALKRDPNNQSLALRIDKMKPQSPEPWLKDVPSDQTIKAAIASRDSIQAKEGANSIYLLDDDVTLLKADGSTVSITTSVTHALNQEGRDDLTKMYVGRSSNTQLMAAYAINPDGNRLEASSIRDGVVRFRQLQIGSTVVLQHRRTHKPEAYLAGHINRNWWFHSRNMQVRNSRLVLWRPKGTPLHEEVRGDVEKKIEVHGDLIRVSWEMNDVAPVITEPRMPSLFSQVFGLTLTTVPDWQEVFKWEKELLREAFRMSPEVEKLSDTLLEKLPTAQDKIYKIQDYVMRNIRYQQDYEHTIAGVKPHTADQVLSRQYGDCKDKAVLFIALAKKAGLKAHFAIVRTRGAGPVEKSVPSQQFNHAIVYVPAQDGIAQGRFYDPTVDALDVQSLRSDDQGTLALVYDPVSEKHYWQDIPFQNSSYDSTKDHIQLTIDSAGKMSGQLLMKSQGRIAQIIRKQARNPEGFKQVMEYRLNQLFAGAQLLDHKAVKVDDLYHPAQVSMQFKHDSWVKKEGDQLRIPSVIDWTPKSLFQLKERRYPLVLGHKKEWEWHTEIKVPNHLDAAHIPSDEIISSTCLSLSRTSEWDASKHTIHITWTYRSECERLTPDNYLKHRDLSRKMMQALNQELVFSPKPKLQKEQTAVPSITPSKSKK